jgi:integrase
MNLNTLNPQVSPGLSLRLLFMETVMATKRHPKYTFKKNGIYYFSRSVPKDIRHHYSTGRLVESLRTKNREQAVLAARVLSSRLDRYWYELRLNENDVPLAHFLANSCKSVNNNDLPTLYEALDLYLRIKGEGKGNNFEIQTTRSIDYFVKATKKKSLADISTKDATKYRDWLIKKGLKMSSLHRYYSGVRAVINFIISESGLEIRNPLIGVYLPPKTDSEKRMSVKGEHLAKLQTLCIQTDDEIRHLLALISDSGMRLGEAVGLLKTDLILDHSIPHISLRPHPHRRLKTSSSKRLIPLIGLSLWAAKKIINSNNLSKHCFPRYSNDISVSAETASANFATWLKTNISPDATVHGLRHGFRDRLRDEKVPTEAIDQMGGWSKRSVGAGYGDGYSLEVMYEFMKRIDTKT